MSKLKEKLMLSEKGYSDLKKAITACTITNIALLLPSMVTEIIFAISGGMVLLSMDSMLLQSAIMFVVMSDKSFVLKKLMGSLRRCSAIRSLVVLASL